MALALIAAGRRVGVTANRHKGICNLVARICKLAEAGGRRLDVLQSGDEDQVLVHPWVRRMKKSADVPVALRDPQVQIVAGTAWLFGRDDMAGALEILFIDEASQFSLVNGVAPKPPAACPSSTTPNA